MECETLPCQVCELMSLRPERLTRHASTCLHPMHVIKSSHQTATQTH